MEKACAHAGAGKPVGRESIESVCFQSQESRIFQVIDSLFAGQGREAMAKFRTLTGDGEGAGAMMSLIERQARLLAAVKAEGRGADARALASLLGAPAFAVEAASRQANRWTGEELASIISMCVKADTGIKQGIMGEQTAVEQLAMNVVYMAANRK
jgi:DNA polymerase-3 subunit delta